MGLNVTQMPMSVAALSMKVDHELTNVGFGVMSVSGDHSYTIHEQLI